MPDQQDQTVVNIGPNSPEYVAYLLMHTIAKAENVQIDKSGGANREWILATYRDCLRTVHRQKPVGTPGSPAKPEK